MRCLLALVLFLPAQDEVDKARDALNKGLSLPPGVEIKIRVMGVGA